MISLELRSLWQHYLTEIVENLEASHFHFKPEFNRTESPTLSPLALQSLTSHKFVTFSKNTSQIMNILYLIEQFVSDTETASTIDLIRRRSRIVY